MQQGGAAMLTAQELKTSPLFHDISYEEYRRMLTCFQAAQRSYVPEEQVYDFTSSRTDAVGIVERGQVSLIRNIVHQETSKGELVWIIRN